MDTSFCDRCTTNVLYLMLRLSQLYFEVKDSYYSGCSYLGSRAGFWHGVRRRQVPHLSQIQHMQQGVWPCPETVERPQRGWGTSSLYWLGCTRWYQGVAGEERELRNPLLHNMHICMRRIQCYILLVENTSTGTLLNSTLHYREGFYPR